MQPGDIVLVHNTPDSIASGGPQRGIGLLVSSGAPDVWDMLVMFDPLVGPFATTGVPRGTEPHPFMAWEPMQGDEYTPVLTPVDNVQGSTAALAFWTRTNGIVQVHGALNVQATTPGDPVTLRISLPVPSNLTDASHLAGTASGGALVQGHSSDAAELRISNGPGSSTLITYSFAYRIR